MAHIAGVSEGDGKGVHTVAVVRSIAVGVLATPVRWDISVGIAFQIPSYRGSLLLRAALVGGKRLDVLFHLTAIRPAARDLFPDVPLLGAAMLEDGLRSIFCCIRLVRILCSQTERTKPVRKVSSLPWIHLREE